MHRDFDPAVEPLARRSAAGIVAFTSLLALLLVFDLVPPLAMWFGFEPPWARTVFGVRYALIAAILGGARVLFTALDAAAAGKIGADLAVAIACLAAILINEPLVAAEVVVIGLVGECLEAATFDRTQRALRKLAELFPLRTWRLMDGVEERVVTAHLSVGDVVVVKPGGKIPVDGTVIDGTSTVDASPLTGESVPLDKTVGDAVLAGSINQFGSLTIRAEKVAKETVAGRVMAITERALQQKPALERQADTLAKRFLPVVLGLALLAFVVNVLITRNGGTTFAAAARVALYPTLAVLVVACPCPLVLATPAAVIAALGRLAGTGVLLKSGTALERLAAVTAIAFDKTGTLTKGELELVGDVPDELLRLAASADQKSEHPIAKVLVNEARKRGLVLDAVTDFQAHPGGGVTAKIAAGSITVGTAKFVGAADADSPHTQIHVSVGGVPRGVIEVRDTLRPEAAGVVDELRAIGLRVSILSGDRAVVAAAVAKTLGIDTVHAALLPAEKATHVDASTAFVGDGVNDAPALATAGVGIAVGGADIAAETSDIVMLGEPLRPLPLLVKLSRETVRIIRQNILVFGFGVNLVGVIVSGFLWPLFAPDATWYENAPLFGVLYHQIGSLAVLINSMRLLRFERRVTPRLFADADRWLNTLHVDDWLHRAGHHWQRIAASVIGITFVVWCLSGLTQVNRDEVGVVQRFGAVTAELPPGLHVRWPWAIEQVTRVKPREVRTVEVGFRVLPKDLQERLTLAAVEQQKLKADTTWTGAHSSDVQRLPEESFVLTGDGSFVEVLATLRYRVASATQYLFGAARTDALLRTLTEAALREVAAGLRFEDVLTQDRTAFERRVFDVVQQRLPPNAGIELMGLTIHDLHPPAEVVAAYHAVAEAIQKRDRAINDATAARTRMLRQASDDALTQTRLTEADAIRKVSTAAAARDIVKAWLTARTTLSTADEDALKNELETRVKNGEDRANVSNELAARRTQMLAARRTLTDLRLTLAATVAALAGRDKILIDAENVPGKRTLFLADPEMFKLPPLTKTEP